MRIEPTILHLDMDAFYASVEQLQKPSVRGLPVIVGGLGQRGVVATASYEARAFGVHSAMPTVEARRLCPEGVFLAPRFHVYRELSGRMMEMLRDLTPVIEPLSLDEAFCDLEAGFEAGLDADSVTALAGNLRSRIFSELGLTASVGAGTSKLMAKIASDLDKPDGLVVVRPGDEQALLGPLPVRALWGVGPQTAALLQRHGMNTVRDVVAHSREELVRLIGVSRGRALFELARGLDHRPVVAERAVKSVSVEETFAEDLTERARLQGELAALVDRLSRRLRASGRTGRTITLKVRRADFTLLARSDTLLVPTGDHALISDVATRLLRAVDVGVGIRLLGVGISGLADAVQGELFEARPGEGSPTVAPEPAAMVARPQAWVPGSDVAHARWGRGWVEGQEGPELRVRFETEATGPRPVRRLSTEDPELCLAVTD